MLSENVISGKAFSDHIRSGFLVPDHKSRFLMIPYHFLTLYKKWPLLDDIIIVYYYYLFNYAFLSLFFCTLFWVSL